MDLAIEKTRAFFESVGVSTRLSAYGVTTETIPTIVTRLSDRGMLPLGERQDITKESMAEILLACA